MSQRLPLHVSESLYEQDCFNELKMRSRKDKTRKVCSQSQKKMKISGIESQHGEEDVAGVKKAKRMRQPGIEPGAIAVRKCLHYVTITPLAL